MSHSKLLLAAIFGLMTYQTAAAIDSHQSLCMKKPLVNVIIL